MTSRVAVTLFCDGGWSPDCHDAHTAEGRSTVAAHDDVRKETDAAGWERRRVGQLTATLCPACATMGGYPQQVYEPYVVVVVRCDLWLAPGCHREYAAAGELAPVAVSHVREEAITAGWTRRLVPDELFTMDICPACRGLKGSPRTPEFMYMS